MSTFAEYFKKEPLELAEELIENYIIPIPDKSIETLEELQVYTRIMNELVNNWSFLQSLLAVGKIYVRNAERNANKRLNNNLPIDELNKRKREYEDMIDRQYAIQRVADIVLESKNAISRNITSKQITNKELESLGGIT